MYVWLREDSRSLILFNVVHFAKKAVSEQTIFVFSNTFYNLIYAHWRRFAENSTASIDVDIVCHLLFTITFVRMSLYSTV